MKRCMLLLAVAVLLLSTRQLARAVLINGDFETGDLTGWTTFTTDNGQINEDVTLFDTNGDSIDTQSATFQVGQIGGSESEGGGIYQDVFLYPGLLKLSADIAASNTDDTAINAQGGIFAMYLDDLLLDSHAFDWIYPNTVERHTLMYDDLVIPSANWYSLKFEIVRPFSAPSWLFQYIDNVAVTPVPEPATMLLLGSGLVGLAGLGRKKFFKK